MPPGDAMPQAIFVGIVLTGNEDDPRARLFTLAHLGILRRPDSVASYSQRLAAELEGRTSGATGSWRSMPAGCVLELEITHLDISSTAIRQILGSGHSPAFLMPGPVIDYIRRHRLYGC